MKLKKVISGKTVKALFSKQGRSEWNLFTLYSVEKKLVKVCDYYKVVKNNITLKDNKKVDYSKLMECNKLSSIIHHFSQIILRKKVLNILSVWKYNHW